MKPKIIKYTPTFTKSLKKLPQNQLKLLSKQLDIFQQNIFDPRLKTHKLKGELADFYAFTISYHWRIIFHIEIDNKTVIFDKIGTHEIYK